MPTKKQIDPIPEEFSTYEEAAQFWDTHYTTDYPDAFRTVKVECELRRRHFEVEIDPDVIKVLRSRARRKGVSTGHLASNLLRQQLGESK